MLIEMARMSTEDGLIMQFHPGSYRNHNEFIFERFGFDKGCDIPVQSEYTRNLRPLLNRFGNDTRLTLTGELLQIELPRTTPAWRALTPGQHLFARPTNPRLFIAPAAGAAAGSTKAVTP